MISAADTGMSLRRANMEEERQAEVDATAAAEPSPVPFPQSCSPWGWIYFLGSLRLLHRMFPQVGEPALARTASRFRDGILNLLPLLDLPGISPDLPRECLESETHATALPSRVPGKHLRQTSGRPRPPQSFRRSRIRKRTRFLPPPIGRRVRSDLQLA